MSYFSTYLDPKGEFITIWSRGSDDILKTDIHAAQYYCYVPSSTGNYNSICHNEFKKVSKKTFKNQWELKAFVKDFKGNELNKATPMFESDIQPELRCLDKHYYETLPANIHITAFDIETDADLENRDWPTISDPYGEILSVAFYHFWLDKFVILVVADKSRRTVTESDFDENVSLVYCDTEEELIKRFMYEIRDTDVFTGWNIEQYDIPYSIGRFTIVLGEEIALTALCRDGIPAKKRDKPNKFGSGERDIVYALYGRVCIDYQLLYEKFTYQELPSYALESVAMHELKYGKIDYDGVLPELYRSDLKTFLQYNVHDVILLRDLERKLGFIMLLNTMAHDYACRFTDIFGTVVASDQVIMTKAHHNRNEVIPDVGANIGNPKYVSTTQLYDEPEGKYAGGFVYDLDSYDDDNNVISTLKGLSDYCASVDIKSEYPNTIISNNISIETAKHNASVENGDIIWAKKMRYDRTKIAELQKHRNDLYIRKKHRSRKNAKVGVRQAPKKKLKMESVLKRTKLLEVCIEHDKMHVIDALENQTWGARNDVVGLVPEVLSAWFDERVEMQRLHYEHRDNAAAILNKYKKGDGS